MKKYLMIAGGIFAVLVIITITISIKDKIYPIGAGIHDPLDLTEGAAVNGNDPVAFFTENKAIKGDGQISYSWNGAKWHFASDSSKKLFVAEPEKYAPQFGGYCALAVSKGFTAHCDASSFLVEDGKLYIFHGEDVKNEFLEAKNENIKLASKNWSE